MRLIAAQGCASCNTKALVCGCSSVAALQTYSIKRAHIKLDEDGESLTSQQSMASFPHGWCNCLQMNSTPAGIAEGLSPQLTGYPGHGASTWQQLVAKRLETACI